MKISEIKNEKMIKFNVLKNRPIKNIFDSSIKKFNIYLLFFRSLKPS